MIRIVASTIIERPMLTHSKKPITKEQLVKQHIKELPHMIQSFRNAIVTVSRQTKWCKLALLRNNVPVEIFDSIRPFLIVKDELDYFPDVASDQHVMHRKYLLLEAKLYRMGLVHDNTLLLVRNYIAVCFEFKEEMQQRHCSLRLFNSFPVKIDFIRYCVMKDGIIYNEYDIEHMLRYWF